ADDVENFTVFDVSNALRERGWLVPAYTFPPNREDLAALRVVVKRGFTHDMASLLVGDLKRQLPRLQRQSAPVHDSTSASGFRHEEGLARLAGRARSSAAFARLSLGSIVSEPCHSLRS